MSTKTLDRVHETPQTGDPILAHIIAPKEGARGAEGVDGATLALEARINGTTVTAICGWVFTPSHDHRSVPNCERCRSLFASRFGDAQPSEC